MRGFILNSIVILCHALFFAFRAAEWVSLNSTIFIYFFNISRNIILSCSLNICFLFSIFVINRNNILRLHLFSLSLFDLNLDSNTISIRDRTMSTECDNPSYPLEKKIWNWQLRFVIPKVKWICNYLNVLIQKYFNLFFYFI